MSLKTYRDKRSFLSTPEPSGQNTKVGKKLSFVVQKHDATRLHYDFRLECGGVLLSWAVPKGPSLNPADKRLAMQTEDHPLDYQNFEGIIPKGNYGAGPVIVWDKGYYQTLDGGSKKAQEREIRQNLKAGKLSFILQGEKLNGEFSLVKSQSDNQENAWLLIKKRDEFNRQADITKQDKSVLSHQGVEQIGQIGNLSDQDWRNFIKKYRLKKAAVSRPIKPMLATLVNEAFSDKDWLFEVKWDGYRAIAEIENGKVKLYSRNQKDFVSTYPAVADDLSKIPYTVVLDGEVTALDNAGKPKFNLLQNYKAGSAATSPVYYVFDLLELDSYNLSQTPLEARKTLLKKLLPDSNIIRYSDHILEKGHQFFEQASQQNLEGIVAKDRTSTYQFGKRSKKWLKIKTVKRQEAVIGGFTEPRGSRKGLGALILGVYDDQNLNYIGHSGTGLSNKQLIEIRNRLDKLERKTSPFTVPPKPNAPVHWVQPKLLAEVEFSEWTASGHMRHPKLVGLRSDKPAQKVGREKPLKISSVKSQSRKSKPKSSVEFSNLDKVFWPKQKLTKGDLISYYQTMSDLMLPYLKNRPMTLLRHPNGAEGKSFFQKDVDKKLAKGFSTFTRYSESNDKNIDYFVTDSREALLYMAQLGCIEINPWSSTTKTPDKPDWLVLDLDPEAISFSEVIEVALTIRQILDKLKVKSFIKTSGKTGMHIYLPLKIKHSYSQVKQLAELLARQVVSNLPKITSVKRSPSQRQGKVYIDFLQNNQGQTLAAPYSVRPTPEATVSMPLTWRQVNKKLKPTDFTLKNVPKIIKQRQDPWADFFKTRNSLEEILSLLEGSHG